MRPSQIGVVHTGQIGSVVTDFGGTDCEETPEPVTPEPTSPLTSADLGPDGFLISSLTTDYKMIEKLNKNFLKRKRGVNPGE